MADADSTVPDEVPEDNRTEQEDRAEDSDQQVTTRKRRRSGSMESTNGGSMEKHSAPERERVAILDAGAQYGKVIDRRVRELNVESDLLPLNTSAIEVHRQKYRAIIISGGGNSVYNLTALPYDPDIFKLDIPILGICYGHQLINTAYGGKVGQNGLREDGQFDVTVDTSCSLFAGLSKRQTVLLTHGDSIMKVGEGLSATGWSGDLVAAIADEQRKVYGVQFHPEVDLTINGIAILKNFLFNVAGCTGVFKLQNREETCLQYIREKVGDAKVVSLVSGGVDSTVCTALLKAALNPDQIIAVLIDNGFMRLNERDKVVESLQNLGLKPQVIDARYRFQNARTNVECRDFEGSICMRETGFLNNVTSAEEKRHIIGDTFVMIVKELMASLESLGEPVYMAQGTLRPDLIESASTLASTYAHVIKTHHNDTALVREMRQEGRVVEPLTDFHKDEVRALGLSLGLPEGIVHRHPFPGPGLAVRVICQDEAYIGDPEFRVTNEWLSTITSYCEKCQQSSSFTEAINKLISQENQHFLAVLTANYEICATVLPIYSVGVQGDSRTYNYVAALSCDSEPQWTDLIKLAKIIPKICHSVNRVVWVFGGVVKGPITDITPTHLTTDVLDTLRQVDNIAQSALMKNDLLHRISQMPVVLIPIHFDRNPEERPVVPSCQRSVVIRTFITADFMTGVPATPGQELPVDVLHDMVQDIKTVSGVSRVLYDLTAKPPGTTEWE